MTLGGDEPKLHAAITCEIVEEQLHHGGFCHELIIFMTSSHILKASTKSLDHSKHAPMLLPIHSDTL